MHGKPKDNASIEAFNARLLQECLNQPWFLSLAQAFAKLEQWRELYNHKRPHSRLGYRTPEEFVETQQNRAEMQRKFSQNFAEPVAEFSREDQMRHFRTLALDLYWGEGQSAINASLNEAIHRGVGV